MKNDFQKDRKGGFVTMIILLVIGLFLLSYLNIFKIENHINPGQIKAIIQSFISWIKNLFA